MAKKGAKLSKKEIELFVEGSYDYSYHKFGAHLTEVNGKKGARFTVWAPNAERVSVIGDFNNWAKCQDCLSPIGGGIWEGFIAGVKKGHLYKYFIESKYHGHKVEKADPYAFCAEVRPLTASRVWDLEGHKWKDSSWMRARAKKDAHRQPMNIYEMHLSSWRHFSKDEQASFDYLHYDGPLAPVSYRDLAESLPAYLNEMGFTHVEFLPVMEYPCDSSWGYQLTGYYAPTSRYGAPEDFMYLVDCLHQHNIGVILDVVPAHFAVDGHGLVYFDGTHLYEHADWRKGYQPEWGTFIFNYDRPEVRNFLVSHVLFWLDKYHIDGLRIDAVAAMIYLNYARKDGEWVPNKNGGNENLEGVAFIQQLNETAYREFPGIVMFAEESTAWPMVSRPTHSGGLGFGMKWNMGWMHDILSYMSEDPVFRAHHHNKLTFGMLYAYNENFVLPFSHDEVVHGKGSLIRKMPGHFWQRFANLRVLFGFMHGYPGKKLLFMGAELGDWDEWWYKRTINWKLLEYPLHQGLYRWIRDLNHFLLKEPSLWERDFEVGGFEWIDCNDSAQNVVSFIRFGNDYKDCVVAVCNFSPEVRYGYRIGVPYDSNWKEVLNSDSEGYGGSGQGNFGIIEVKTEPYHSRSYSVEITLPPLASIFLKPTNEKARVVFDVNEIKG